MLHKAVGCRHVGPRPGPSQLSSLAADGTVDEYLAEDDEHGVTVGVDHVEVADVGLVSWKQRGQEKSKS